MRKVTDEPYIPDLSVFRAVRSATAQQGALHMTLEDDLTTWLATRPDWQKQAVARFCRGEELSPSDICEIADHLVADSHPTVEPISKSDIPGTSVGQGSVQLGALSNISGVNALLPDQRLSFGPSGLTVIYGDNGSGKSGYARMIREAVTARIKAPLLPDVFSSAPQQQAATVEFAVAGASSCWSLGDPQSKELSSILFYDEECGDSYVTTAAETNYRPSALTILDRLSAACDLLRKELVERASANQREKPELPLLVEESTSKSFLAGLSASTTVPQVESATTLTEDHAQLLAHWLDEEARLQRSDPSKEKQRLARLATLWSSVHTYVDQLAKETNKEALDRVLAQREKAEGLQKAAELASSANFSAEPLEGVGSVAWRALWEAAQKYSVSHAYRGHTFPKVDEGAVCVLCQQDLGAEGADRLSRFNDFVSNTTSRDAMAAERELKTLSAKLHGLAVRPAAVSEALVELKSNDEQTAAVETWIASGITSISVISKWAINKAPTLPTEILDSVSPVILARASALTDASTAIDAETFLKQRKDAKNQVAELQGRGLLAGSKANLISEIARLKVLTSIESAKRLTDTTGITRKATELSTTHVTNIVRDQFTRETERLRIRRVTLNPSRGRRTVTLEHQPELLGTSIKAQINSVLSEGEQTALGLAGFLTEVMFDGSRSGVVLDDPVSSLDAGRRSLVAHRIVELAQDRQVIVFTHEATFVTALNKEARDQGVEIHERAVLRVGNQPGKTVDQHPWKTSDTPARISELEQTLSRLKKDRQNLDDEEYARLAQDWAGRLSQTWERAVNLDIVNHLVDRGTNEVKPRMFKMLPKFTDQDDLDYQSGYGKTSEWAVRHDQAPEVNFVPPEPSELETELVRLKSWTARVKSYKK